MAFIACTAHRTAVGVVNDIVVKLPIGATDWSVVEKVGFSSEILPIMRVDALRLVVRQRAKRTHHGLELEHEEIVVLLQTMQQLYQDLLLMMREGAELTVLAVIGIVRVLRAKLRLIFVCSV